MTFDLDAICNNLRQVRQYQRNTTRIVVGTILASYFALAVLFIVFGVMG